MAHWAFKTLHILKQGQYDIFHFATINIAQAQMETSRQKESGGHVFYKADTLIAVLKALAYTLMLAISVAHSFYEL